jgi:type IV pilus assembly protein PilM
MKTGIRSRPWAGLDVGSFSVKVYAPQPGGAPRYLIGESPLPVAEGDRPIPAETVAQAIADCMSRAGLSTRALRGLTLGVSGADVIVKQISLPLLDESEVGPALRFEARKHLPFDPQTMTIDFQILGRFPSEKRLDVLLAAVSNERMQRLIAPLQLLGIEPDVVDATPLALTNAIANQNPDKREASILLDIGHRSSHLTLYQKGEPYFSRRLDFGGRSITQAISRATRVPFEEAEEWKLAAGSDEPGIRVDWNSPELQAALECLRVELVDELLRSLAFYRTLGRLPDPLRLAISGGSARLPGLAIRLSDLLGSPVALFNPLDAPGSPSAAQPSTIGPQFAQAYGLSLRAA